MESMRASPCMDVQLPDPERVALLLEDYGHFVRDPDFFSQRLRALTEMRGHQQVTAWIEAVQAGRTAEVVHALLSSHYDPMYAHSIARNFVRYACAMPCVLADRSTQTLTAMASQLIQEARDTPAELGCG